MASWVDELAAIVETTSTTLKTARSAGTASADMSAAAWARRPPLAVANRSGVRSGSSTPATDGEENRASESSAGSSVLSSSSSSSASLQHDVSAVKSAVVQVAAEVGRHAQATIDTRNRVVRLGDEAEAYKEALSGVRQRLVEMETQRSQQATMMAGMRRTCEALRQQYAHLQSAVNERATRSEVSASVRASIDPVRAQVQAALHHYSEGLATATATAAAAVHSANEANRRSISTHVRASSQSGVDLSVGDPEILMNTSVNASLNQSYSDGHRSGGVARHREFSANMELIEARVERRMMRSIEDKIELEMSRARDSGGAGQLSVLVSGGRDGGEKKRGSDGNSGGEDGNGKIVDNATFRSWQLELDRKMQECFQRVLEMGGKIAEEAQRRHLAVSATRASMRTEAKRIDELQAAAAVIAADTKSSNSGKAISAGGADFAEAAPTPQALPASLKSRIDTLIEQRMDDAMDKMTETLSATMMQMLSSFEKKWEAELNKRLLSHEERAENAQSDLEKLGHDLKAVRKLALIKAPSSSSASASTAGDGSSSSSLLKTTSGDSQHTKDMREVRRENGRQIQRAQERFDRQIKELRSEMRTKGASQDRVLGKIEESVNRAMSIALKSGSKSSSGITASMGVPPPRKPKGPPPPNAKRVPSTGVNNHQVPPPAPSTSTSSSLAETSLLAQGAAGSSKNMTAGDNMQKKEDVKKFQEEVTRTRNILSALEASSSAATASKASISSSTPLSSTAASSANEKIASNQAKKSSSSANTSIAPKAAKPKERLQCPFCLKRFDGDALPAHKTNCDCRTVHCQFCGKGRMARQLKTHEQFCDQNPKNATKSEKKKCKYCDKYFTTAQLAAHKCSWEPRQCKYCHMQIIARDIARHEEKCASKQSKKKTNSNAVASNAVSQSTQESTPVDAEVRCCSFGDCDCSSFVPSTSSRVRPSHPHLICATCGHGALYHQSPAAQKALQLRSSIDGITWAKEFQAEAIGASPKKASSAADKKRGKTSPGVAQKVAMASGKVPIRAKKKPAKTTKSTAGKTKSALMQVAESMKKEKTASAESAAATSSLLMSAGVGGELRSSSSASSKMHPSEWTVDQVTEFLEQHGISEKIRDRFVEQVIDGYMLLNMDQSDLANDLGITRRSDQTRLLGAVKHLKLQAKSRDQESSSEDSSDFDHSSDDSEGE